MNMGLGVQSFPELFTTILGWDLYDKLWELLTQTGLVYIPFIGIILKNVSQSYVMHGAKGSEFSLRAMELNLLTTLLLLFFGAAPCIPLNIHGITFTPQCGSDKGSIYTPGNTSTTYDKAFSLPQTSIRVPIFWYGVISISEGITSAAKTMVGCVPDLRKMITEINIANIKNPETKAEIDQFNRTCYVPARTKYLKDVRENNASTLARVEDAKKRYGIADTEWMGSHALTYVYYPHLKANQPIPKFPYQPADDLNADVVTKNRPAYGTPNCAEWWADQQFGLRERLRKVLSDHFYASYSRYLNTDEARDDVLKVILTGSMRPYKGYENANTMIGDNGISRIVSSIGILAHQFNEYPKIYAAMQAAPIVQSLLLLMTYVFLPFGLVFSGYKPSTFVTGAVLIFSFIFWSFIWQLVSLTDKALMSALYPGWFAQQGAGATLTDLIIGSLVIGAPIFWFLVMGSLGIAVGQAMNGFVMGLHKVGQNGAATGTKAAGMAATAATKLV